MSATRALSAVVAPVYLARLGYSGFELGVLFAVIAIASAALSAGVGLLSDRIGRRPFLIVFPFLTAAAAFAFTAHQPTWVLFTAAALGSFGRGAGGGGGTIGPYQPAESALVMELTPDSARNVVFGRLAFGASLGALIGGGLAVLTDAGGGHAGAGLVAAFRPAFVVTGLAAVLAGVLAFWIVEPRPRRSPPADCGAGVGGAGTGEGATGNVGTAPPRRRSAFPRRSLPLLVKLWITNSFNGLAVGMFGPFVTYWLYRRYGATPGQIGALFAVINLVTMVSVLSAAGMARRWGLVRTVSVVRAVQAVLLIPMVLAPTFVIAGGIYLVRMIFQRAGLPLRQSYVIAMAHPDERASVAALSNVPSQVTMAASPLLSGYLLDEVSLTLPFEIAGVLQLVNAVTFWLFFRHSPPADEVRGPAVAVAAVPVDTVDTVDAGEEDADRSEPVPGPGGGAGRSERPTAGSTER
jgi:MFS family permease